MAEFKPWPHQTQAVEGTLAAIGSGTRKVLVTSPTGGGKTWVAAELIRRWLSADKRVVMYSNRRMLIDQISESLNKAGLRHGVRASGVESERWRDLQVSSIQTEHSRVFRTGRWQLHDAEAVLIDEAHLNKSSQAREIMQAHLNAGAAIVGLTATPLDLGDLYDVLIVAGKNSELRACGALVPCLHYGPDEPDLRHIGKIKIGEDLSEAQTVKAIMVPGLFGRVIENYRSINSRGLPTILFAPGVGESIWFAEEFSKAGIKAAHIDGAECWFGGRAYKNDKAIRAAILASSKAGECKVVCNRFVLREGIDAPWLAHGIFATVFGSLQSYLQSGGRLLRAHPSLKHVTLQDHGGNWWRHGSLNEDRDWELGQTSASVAALREEQLRHPPTDDPKAPREPIRCPQCQRILACNRCSCGWEASGWRKSRPVVMQSGEMAQMVGDIYAPRRTTRRADAQALWTKIYFRCLKTGRTFRQAEALFAYENKWAYPPRGLKGMPRKSSDWLRRVCDVPREDLL